MAAAGKSALPKIFGALAVGGTGYYFYQAGGNPKGAKERAEADLHKAAADAKAHVPYSRETDAQGIGARTGAKFDDAISETHRQYSRAESEAKGLAHDAKARVQEFDNKVESEAAKAKETASGWLAKK